MTEKEFFHKGDHWELSYLWTSYSKDLLGNRITAMYMLKNTERRLSQNLYQTRIYNK